jgi:dihydropteroate synthase
MALRVRLTEVQCEADSLAAAQAAGLATPEGGLRGWAALLNPAPPSLCDGLGRVGLQVLRGTRGALALGSLPLLGRAGQGLEGSLADAEGRALAGELHLRATAVEAGCAAPGLGAPGGGRPRWTLPRSRLPEGRTLVMGIVNVTPDSFSDGGRFFDPGRAIEHGLALAREGADLLDVGGESTNPFVSQPVDAAEEIRRIEPVVRELALRAGVPVSVDTSKVEVAARALEAGAEVVNDVSGLAREGPLARLCAERGAALCLMHLRGTPQDMQTRARYDDLFGEVLAELEAALQRARAGGVPDERVVLDPGLGFAKTGPHNLALLRRQRELLQLGRPLLIGASRKSFIGRATGREPQDRLAGSIAAAAIAASNGAAIVRVHDVAQTREALAVADAVSAASP